MIQKLFDNYEAFYNMLLSTTIMSNSQTEEFRADAEKLISFIGRAYRLDEEFILDCKAIILDELSSLGLTTDQKAIYSSRSYGDKFSDADALYDIKGDVLSKLQNLDRGDDPNVNTGWFDYSHYKTYQAEVRFAKINITGASGNLIAARQVALLRMLGIGCEKRPKEAVKRLMQCSYWGDIPSVYYLAYTYSLIGNEKESKIFYELAELCSKYLYTGCTILPDDETAGYSKEAKTYYVYISSIKQDIISAYAKKNIDFSFVEAISSSKADYYSIINFINNYEKKEWKEITNSSANPGNKIGFN